MNKHFLAAALVAGVCPVFAQSGNPAITTGQYNSGRTSGNSSEVILSPSNVNVNQFGKLFSWAVDGWIFAQPLYVPGVSINGATRNVVYVATMHNSIYAFNADDSTQTPLWKVNFGSSVTAPTSSGCPAAWSTGPELGILSTPVIDPSTQTLYAVSASPSGGGYVHFLHALDITTGKEKLGGPVQIQASVSGSGYDAQGGRVTLSPTSTNVQRTSLLLANGTVYAGFGGCGPDPDPWHGWVVGYNAANLSQTFVFNTTPNGGQGGIWQSGRGLVVDSSGDVYFNTGNSTVYNNSDTGVTTCNQSNTSNWNTCMNGDANQGNYPMRFVQMNSVGQFLASYPPANYAELNKNDLDFSSSGPLLIPGTNLLVTGGKDGVVYVFNSNNLATPQQSFQATGTSGCPYSMDGCDQIHDLAFWNSTLYVWGSNDVLRAYTFNSSTGKFNTTPASQNTITTGYHPASLAVSGNASQGGIVWAVTPDNGSAVPAMLHAFNASNVASELWNSNQNSGRDGLPSYPKFTEPTVANGRVYVATHSNQLAVYGLLGDFTVSSSVTSQSVYQGKSTSFGVQVTSLSGFNSPVNLTASGLPSGATASFNPSSITGSGSSTATITTASSTPTGTYNVLITGTGGGKTRTASVSLTVTTPDTTPPQWTCCSYSTNGSTYTLGFTGWDTQSGLKSITAVQVVNATVSIPSFPVGTKSVINFSETEKDTSSYVKFQLTDVAGNSTFIDPITIPASRDTGKPVPIYVKDVTPLEGFVNILNGNPGLKNLRIDIDNGLKIGHIQVAGLKDGENRLVNIVSLLPPGGATVTIAPLGSPGGSATIIFASGSLTPQ